MARSVLIPQSFHPIAGDLGAKIAERFAIRDKAEIFQLKVQERLHLDTDQCQQMKISYTRSPRNKPGIAYSLIESTF